MNLIGAIEEGIKKETADFNVGDTVKVYVKVVEGDKERDSAFPGCGNRAERERRQRNFYGA